MIHALRTHAKRTLAAAFAAAFALGSALTLSACSGKPAKQTGSNSTLVPQTEVPTVSATATPAPEETATPFVNPTYPPATPVPVVGEYTKPCQKVKVDFPATELTRAFSVTFDLPEGWTVRSDEGVYTDSSYSDFGFNLPAPIRILWITAILWLRAKFSMMKTAKLPELSDSIRIHPMIIKSTV